MSEAFAEEIEVASQLARRAGEILLEIYTTDFAVVQKPAGGGPVTEADLRASEFLVRELRAAFPGDGVVSEEVKDTSDSERFSRCWFIDPLDGTKEFVDRSGQFAVQIGLAVEGEAKVGVVYRPVGDRLYAGAVGGDAVVEIDGRRRALRFPPAPEGPLRLVVSRSHRSRRIDALRRRLGVDEVIESGSVGLKCGILAEGLADLYVHASAVTYRWDSCGPEAIVRAAGGVLTGMDGAPYRYDGDEMQNLRGLLCCGEEVFERVLQEVHRLGQEADLLA